MSRILCLETSAARCSVALFEGERLLAYRFTDEDRAHSRKLTIFIKEVLEEAGLQPAGLDAVAYSAGPGSYTGLRVGLSTAKGLAFSLDIPLISVPTSRVFFLQALEQYPEADSFHTLQDARRMEAYITIYNKEGIILSEDTPTILDEAWSGTIMKTTGQTVICGTGAGKTRSLFADQGNIAVLPFYPDARYMVHPALDAWRDKRFDNILLSEPKYVKAPNITRPKTKSA